MSSLGKEKYRLYATIKIKESEFEGIEGRAVENILCKVFLPDRKVDAPCCTSYRPRASRRRRLSMPALFSVRAKLTEQDGSLVVITADKVHIISHRGKVWGPDLIEYVLIGEPWDLKVEHVQV